jgi:serine/threonine-protein kinase
MVVRPMRICPRCRLIYAEPVAHCGLDGTRIIEQDEDPLLGKTLDRYRIVSRLGKGAMGIVYRAQHSVISREYAIKVLFGELASNEKVVERLRREAQTVSQIRHPNIVSVEDFGRTKTGMHFLVMELVEGRTLLEAIRAEAPFPPARAAAIALQIARGLSEAHHLGFVHRDLKPSNIMLTTIDGEERVKVLDFGVVAMTNEDDSQDPLTAAGAFVGTPMYMAPEQRESIITPSVDLYSLGVILHELLAGEPPFRGKPGEVMLKHATEQPPELPPCDGLERLVSALLEKSSADRPASAADVVRALEIMRFDELRLDGPPTGKTRTDVDVIVQAPPTALDEIPEVLASPTIRVAPELPMEEPRTWDVEELAPPAPPPEPKPSPPPIRAKPVTELAPPRPEPVRQASKTEPRPKPEPRGGNKLFVAGGLLLLAAFAGFFLIPARERPKPQDPPPPPVIVEPPVKITTATVAPPIVKPPPIAVENPALAVVEVELQQAMSERGLTIADLDELPAIAPVARAWQETRKVDRGERALAATKSLIAEIQKAQINVKLLRKKLDRAGARLGAFSGDAPPPELAELIARHGQLSQLVKPGLTPADYVDLAIMIAILEDDAHRLERSDAP